MKKLSPLKLCLLTVLCLFGFANLNAQAFAGPETRVSDMGPDGNPAFDATSPSIIYNPLDERYFIVWTGDDDQGGNVDDEGEVFGQFFDLDGTEIGADKKLTSFNGTGDNTYSATQPRVVWNSINNEYLVVFTGNRLGQPGKEEVHAKLFDSEGNPITNRIKISNMSTTTDNRPAGDPKVVYNATDNEYLIVWNGIDGPGLQDIWAQKLAGNPVAGSLVKIGFNVLINDRASHDSPRFPDVAWNSTDNRYFIAWQGELVNSEQEIFGQTLLSDLSTFGGNIRYSSVGLLFDPAAGASEVAISYDVTNNQFLLVFEGRVIATNEREIFGQLVTNFGMEEGVDFRITFDGPGGDLNFVPQNPDAVWNESQQAFIVVFEAENSVNGEYEIYEKRLDGTGAVFLGNKRRLSTMGPNGNTAFDAQVPAIATSGDTSTVVVWFGDDASGEDEIYARFSILLPDTDNDSIRDYVEDVNWNNTFEPGETNPLDDDTDDDGIIDGHEDANQNGIVDAGETDPLLSDTDGDSILDGTEIGLIAPEGIQTDLDTFVADLDPFSVTDPLNANTDGGDCNDGVEDANQNGMVDLGEFDPVDPLDDTDNDGDSFSECGGDCDDTNILIFPGATEFECDGIDQNCNGMADEDLTPPVVTCPNPLLAFMLWDSTCNSTIIDVTSLVTYIDNCDLPIPASISQTPPAGSAVVGHGFDIFFTVQASDTAGNIGNCDFFMPVYDQILPTVECPNDTTLPTDGGMCSRTLDNFIGSLNPLTDLWDNCSSNPLTDLAYVQLPPSGTIIPKGDSTITFEVTDLAGNTGTCSFVLSVVDTEAPTMVCNPHTIELDSSGVDTLWIADVVTSSSDNCGIETLAFWDSDTIYECTDLTYVPSTYIDQSVLPLAVNNNSVDIAQVFIADTTGLLDSMKVFVLDNTPSAEIWTLEFRMDDPTGTLLTSELFTPDINTIHTVVFASPPLLMKGMTYSFSIIRGNLDGIRIESDGANPLSDPSEIMYMRPNGGVWGPAPLPNNDLSFETYLSDFKPGAIVVATDSSGNSTYCVSAVTVEDNIAPYLSCSDVSVNLDSTTGQGTLTVDMIADTLGGSSYDNCSLDTLYLDVWDLSCADIAGTTITLTALDKSGNSNSCSITATALDVDSPEITLCPSIDSIFMTVGLCSGTLPDYIALGSSTAWDICTSTPSQSPAAGATFSHADETMMVDITFTDPSGNAGICSFTSILVDTLSPSVLTCPATFTVYADAACSDTVPDFVVNGEVTFSDNCGPIEWVGQPQMGTTISGYGSSLAASVVGYDSSGNSASCLIMVELMDTIHPEAMCPPNDLAISSNPTMCGLNYSWSTAGITDNCALDPVLGITESEVNGSFFPVGLTEVWIWAQDKAGLRDSCSFLVEVIDVEYPVITACPGDISIPNFPGECYGVALWTLPIMTDNCPGVITSSTSDPGDLMPIGTTTVTYTATDSSGLSTTCVFDFSVFDAEVPVPTCPPQTNILVDSTNLYDLEAFAPALITDNCSTITYSQIPFPGSVTLSGIDDSVLVTLTVVDGNSNAASCDFLVITVDNEFPTVICPNDTLVPLDSNCEYMIGDYTVLTEATDNGPFIITQDAPAGFTTLEGDGDVGVVTMTVTDIAAQEASCSFTITAIDTVAPTFSCPSDTTIYLDALCDFITPTFTPLSLVESCTNVLLQDPVAGTPYSNDGTTIAVSLDITDDAGNIGSCGFTVTLTDSTSPGLTCPADTISYTDGSCHFEVGTYTPILETDNCVYTLSQDPAPTTILTGLSLQPVKFMISDPAGNIDSCTFNIVPTDSTAPVIACPVDSILYLDAGCNIEVYSAAPTSISDNCDGAPTFYQNPVAGTLVSAPTSVDIYLIGMDADGNMDSCSYNITGIDTIDPVLTCPADMTVTTSGQCEVNVTYLDPTILDNCPSGSPSLVSGLGSGGLFQAGPNIEKWMIADGSGNIDSCSFEILVNDGASPVLSCPTSPVYMLADSFSCDTVANYLVSATDNCMLTDLRVVSGPAFGDPVSVGTTTVLIEAEDTSFNIISCTFDIIVEDHTGPLFGNCPSDTTLNNLPNNCNQSLIWGSPGVTDNCSGISSITSNYPLNFGVFNVGTTLVENSAIDNNGNISTCVFNVTVLDIELPTIVNCPANITAFNTDAMCEPAVFWPEPTISDNCPSFDLTKSHNNGVTFPVGTTNVVYLIEDASGLLDSCVFSVTVINTETTPPAIVCPADTTYLLDAGVCVTNANYTRPVGTDNCPYPSTALTTGPDSSSLVTAGAFNVVYTVTDASGLTASCNFTISVGDTSNPSITCPNDTMVNNTNGECGAFVVYPSPTATDECGIVTLNRFEGLPSGNLHPIDTTWVGYEGIDQSGNRDSCRFFIMVTDVETPLIACPLDTMIYNDPNTCGGMLNFLNPIHTDNCASTLTQITGLASGSTFPVGITAQLFEASDANGLSSQCGFTVTVMDTTPPMILCPEDLTVAVTPGSCDALITNPFNPGTDITDQCGPVIITMIGLGDGTYPVGTTPSIWMVSDTSGNTSTCEFNFIVEDNEAPVIYCPGNMTIGLPTGSPTVLVSFAEPASLDNCPGSWVSLTEGIGNNLLYVFGEVPTTYVAMDSAGNTDSCSFLITITDDESPSISCPANISVFTDPGVCGANITYTVPVGTDNSAGPITSMVGIGSGNTFPIGLSTETYTVVDVDSNMASCSFTVTVTDNQTPGISCPANMALVADSASCVTLVSWTNPVGTDNCSSTTAQTSGPSNPSILAVGTYFVDFKVTDVNGNADSCSFGIVVEDNINPEISCPGNISVSTDLGMCGAVVTYSGPTGTDNCGVSSINLNSGLGSGEEFPAGVSTEEYVIYDNDGNSSSCSFTITVNDTEKPTFSACPAPIFTTSDTGLCTKAVTWPSVDPMDNCGIMTTTSSHVNGADFLIGTNFVLITTVDSAGNSEFCVFNITVQDVELPTIDGCPTSDVFLDTDSSLCGTNVSWGTITAHDNCSGVSLTGSHSSGSFFESGETTVVYVATDDAGNSDSCSFMITVTDQEIPAITCPDPIQVSTDTNNCDATVAYLYPIHSDNCPDFTVIQLSGLGSGAQFPIGVTTEAYQIIDDNNNAASCSFTISVSDDLAPVFASCPDSMIVSNISGQCQGIGSWMPPTAIDNCTTISLNSNFSTGSSFPIGTTTVIYLATDGEGNVADCSFDVTVNDIDQPIITCPSNITESIGSGTCGANIISGTPLATDNCGLIDFTNNYNNTPNGNDVYPMGPTVVQWTATDPSGNFASCNQLILVEDTENPVFTNCPTGITVSNDLGQCGAAVNWGPIIATDNNCNSPVISGTSGSGDFFSEGTSSVTLTASDGQGNSTDCDFTITVLDDESPVFIACPLNISIETNVGDCDALALWSDPTVIDNCSNPTFVPSHPNGSFFAEGNTTVTYTATDDQGNSGTCQFVVTVFDLSPPLFSCPPSITLSTDPNTCSAVHSYTLPFSTDACGAVANQIGGLGTGATFPLGNTVESWEAEDPSGNISTCAFTITVEDNDPPMLGCPNNISVTADPGQSTVVVVYATPIGLDNCSGVVPTVLTNGQVSGTPFPIGNTLVGFEAVDADGNVSSCSFVVTVNPSASCPVEILCPGALFVTTDVGQCDAIVNYPTPTGTGNCSPSTSLTSGFASGSDFPVGLTVVNYMVSDPSGSSAFCSFTVLVTDNETPTLSCPSDIVETETSPGNGAIVTFNVSATDNCPVSPVLVAGNNSGSTFPEGTTTVTYSATDNAGLSSNCSFNITVIAASPICAQPTNLTVTNVGTTSAMVHWDAPGVTNFQLAWRPLGGTYSTMNLSGVNSFLIPNLNPLTTYEWKIKDLCNNPGTMFGWTGLESFTTQSSGCVQPTNLAVNSISSTSALLSWTAPGVLDFQVAYRPVGGTYTTVNVSATNSVTINNLTPFTTYEWKIKDRCNNPSSVFGWTGLQSFTTQSGGCVKPNGLVADQITSSSARLSWVAPGVSDFQIAWRPVGGIYSTKNVSGVTSDIITDLAAGTTYEWKVKDLCSLPFSSLGWTSLASFTTPASGCVQPSNLVVTGISGSSATLNWSAPGVASVQVAYRPITNPTTSWSTTNVTGSSSLLLNNLIPSMNYEWKIKDLCNSPGSMFGFTGTQVFATNPSNCSQPADLSASSITPTTVHLAWTTTTSVPLFQVAIRRVDIPNQTWMTHNVTPNSLDKFGLVAGASYEWKAKDLCNAGTTVFGWSTTAFFTTPLAHAFGGGAQSTGTFREVNVYPNPFSSTIHLEIRQDEITDLSISIVDMLGKQLKSYEFEGEQGLMVKDFDLSELANGIYFIRVFSGDEIKNYKIEKR